MNPISAKEAEQLWSAIAENISKIKKTEIVICPPFLYLEKLRKISKKISLGAQDSFWDEAGAFTGEVSTLMLCNVGVKYVILGHSERRALGESSVDINKKIKAVLQSGMRPILCVGENTRDENHEYFNLVKVQLEECLAGISKSLITKIIIAYEPVWAISSTQNRHDATPLDCQEMIIFIRKVLTDKFGVKTEMPRIIYGGFVNERDALGFLQDGGVDGLLSGKASLNAKKFVEIIKIAEKI